jgi:2-methylisocitrate lyase-like PEP mutase family enzyme
MARVRPDGEGLDLAENLDVVGRIAAAVDLPVTADLERGYGRTPDDVAAAVQRSRWLQLRGQPGGPG